MNGDKNNRNRQRLMENREAKMANKRRKLISDQELKEKIEECTKTFPVSGEQYIHYKAGEFGVVREFTMKLDAFNQLTETEKKRLFS